MKPTSDAHPNVEDSEEAQDGSTDASQSKKAFKYKYSHLEDLILGNKYSPIKTRSTFREDPSMLGLIYMMEPSFVDEALSDDDWILVVQEE